MHLRIPEYLIVALMVVAGHTSASPWLILVGIIGLCIGSYARIFALLQEYPTVPPDAKISMVAHAINAACASGGGYLLGVGIRTFFS